MDVAALWQEASTALNSPWMWLLWAGYILVLGGWIIRQKREPVATVAWLLGLAWLPVLGFAVYWALGPQRLQRRRLKRLRARLRLAEALHEPCGDPARTDLETLAMRVGGFPPTTATRVELLSGGAATYDALLSAIAAAEHSIHLEYYIFEPDAIGTRFRDALAAKARAGIKVRLLLDGVGASRCSPHFLAPLRDAGAEVAWFHPLVFAQVLWRRTVNLRTHRKLVVIDGRFGFTGGVNIADAQYERVSSSAAFHDLHLRLDGEVVRALQLAFVEDWHYCSGVALGDVRLWPELPVGSLRTQLLPSGPDNPWAPIHRVYIEAIHQARQRVWLMTPYFVPDAPALQALTSAAQRGLDVRVLLPRRNDSRLVRAAACSFYRELLDAGVMIHEFQPRMLHGKALLLDEDLACIGTANFDPRSFRLNFELALLVRDPVVAAALAARFSDDLADSTAVPQHWQPGRWADLGHSMARLLAPLL